LIPDPPKLQGTLRDYQKTRCVLAAILEALGLNGCLADDMDWKVAQVIVRLVNEKESMQSVPPTLLIAPTSVVGTGS